MCGIAGIVHEADDPAVQGRIESMLACLAMRGPDASGCATSGRVTLGHRRLAILDLDPRSNQPFNAVPGYSLSFNGEIYNYKELRDEIGARYRFQTTSDTEVLYAALIVWGSEAFAKLNGDWAFAYYDHSKDELTLCRDRYGAKPLYWGHKGKDLMFASSKHALLAGGLDPEINVNTLNFLFQRRRFESREASLFSSIRPVNPGEFVVFDGKGQHRRSGVYYRVGEEQPPRYGSYEDTREQFGALFQDCVTLRLQSDVPVGIMLSGGMDSSSIAALAKRAGCSPRLFSASFPGFEFDEFPRAARVAKMLGLEQEEVPVSADDFFARLGDVVRAHDAPIKSAGLVARYVLYERCADFVKVILEGQGGDELFGGYDKMFRLVRAAQAGGGDAASEFEMVAPKAKQNIGDIPALSELNTSIRLAKKSVETHFVKFDYSDETRTQHAQSITNTLMSLLYSGDALQMAWSLEGRMPMLDHRLVNFVFHMPLEWRFQSRDKWILRDYMQSNRLLPDDIIENPVKLGFPTNTEDVLRSGPRAKARFTELYHAALDRDPGFIDRATALTLLEEFFTKGRSFGRVLLILTLLIYVEQAKLNVPRALQAAQPAPSEKRGWLGTLLGR